MGSAFFAGLTVGKEQAGRSRENAKIARWGWSGADKIVPPFWSEAELLRIIGLLPSLQSPVEDILAELQALGGRYHRYLHQDEFGPTRAERLQALRSAIVILRELSSRFESLPPQLRLLLSEKLSEHHSATERSQAKPVSERDFPASREINREF